MSLALRFPVKLVK